jgi:hypothetical protein
VSLETPRRCGVGGNLSESVLPHFGLWALNRSLTRENMTLLYLGLAVFEFAFAFVIVIVLMKQRGVRLGYEKTALIAISVATFMTTLEIALIEFWR